MPAEAPKVDVKEAIHQLEGAYKVDLNLEQLVLLIAQFEPGNTQLKLCF
jgi:hypothetical protein